ncbi:MAG: hypothetical protein H7249_13980 [Chitinophagaceae bacterium]|nr:hypothetical protein [Oligoflexus sp.]
MEKLIQANALFRNSLEGRFALDINRSILQTGIAAHAPLQDYVTYVLRASPEDVQSRPENFTALAYSRMNSQLTESPSKQIANLCAGERVTSVQSSGPYATERIRFSTKL